MIMSVFEGAFIIERKRNKIEATVAFIGVGIACWMRLEHYRPRLALFEKSLHGCKSDVITLLKPITIN